jgi:hypothetical protein
VILDDAVDIFDKENPVCSKSGCSSSASHINEGGACCECESSYCSTCLDSHGCLVDTIPLSKISRKRVASSIFTPLTKKVVRKSIQSYFGSKGINHNLLYPVPTNKYNRFCNAFAVYYTERYNYTGKPTKIQALANKQWSDKYKKLSNAKRYIGTNS